MTDHQAYTEEGIAARKEVVSFADAMLSGKLSFLEGASKIHGLVNKVGGVRFDDPDFIKFTAIVSDTDHLPLEKQRSLWQPEALARLEPEIKEKEQWARSFATAASKNLISRFGASKI